MNSQDHLQLELFSQPKTGAHPEKGAYSRKFLNYIWSYEKTILTALGIIITVIASYSLGMERGKRSAITPQPAATLEKKEADIALPKKVVIEPKKINTEAITPKGYTIQLASYKTHSFAQKEANKLKKNGHLPLILSKGQYVILCVGNFPDRNSAQSLLSELKKQYQGCYIRRL
ncbi:MAG: SPOR domain-containing protein [Candidatus Omnitrophota bacterium]